MRKKSLWLSHFQLMSSRSRSDPGLPSSLSSPIYFSITLHLLHKLCVFSVMRCHRRTDPLLLAVLNSATPAPPVLCFLLIPLSSLLLFPLPPSILAPLLSSTCCPIWPCNSSQPPAVIHPFPQISRFRCNLRLNVLQPQDHSLARRLLHQAWGYWTILWRYPWLLRLLYLKVYRSLDPSSRA